jgi:hypothetical protein
LASAAAPFEEQQLTIQHPGGQGAQLAGLQLCALALEMARPLNRMSIKSTFFISSRFVCKVKIDMTKLF